MARKDEFGLMQATAEDLTVKTPDEVPEWVDCFVSKRQVAGSQARYVAFSEKKNVWIHKRFLGEFDVIDDDEDEVDEFAAEYDDLDLETSDDEGDEGDEAEGPAETPAETSDEDDDE